MLTASNLSGKISVAGSSSVTPVMEKLAEGCIALNPNVTIEVNQSDSSTGVSMATEGTCDISMASRDLKESESAVKASAIATLPGVVFGDDKMASAIIDRIMHHGRLVEFNGASKRMEQA